MKNYLELCQIAKDLGAEDAKIISTEQVVTAPWVTLKCRYGCDSYNATHCCPPRTPSYKETREILNSYHYGVLIMTNSLPRTTPLVVKIEREIFLRGFYKAFGLGAGPCKLCTECNLERCRHPLEARPSMEACGIDVYATARAAGFNLEVLRDKEEQETCFGLILIE
ncbi:DUF2284 domain-containing protein [Carboxydothermus islandicus]|uniref:DUF2284 domain-containing protein n=1 Tax=Carboxydothermus islandicus TaxID=661089 RepID=UPI0014122458|nr:DUF2284 domain-containing protein [Carboxydothermus islandicus]